MPAPTTLLMPQRHVGGALSCLSGVGVDGAHNTIGEMSVPTTLLGFYHARKVAGHYPIGAHRTVVGIAVDLSALPYFLCLFPGPYRAGIPGRLVPVDSDCASQRRAVSRGSVYPWSEMRVKAEVVFGQAFRSERPSGGGPELEASIVPP